jgi:hypothetical protein
VRAVAPAVALLLAPAAALAQDADVRLGITIAPDGRLEGEIEVAFTNETRAPLDEVVLRLLPNHLSELPDGVGEVNFHWVYPGDFDPASMTLDEVRQSDRPLRPAALERGGRVARVRLAVPVPAGARTAIRVRYHARVPARFGRFGRANGRITLAGGAYPELARLAADGFHEDEPTPSARFLVRLTVPAELDVVLGGLYSPAPRTRSGDWREIEAALVAPYLSILLAPSLAESRRAVAGGSAVYLGPSADRDRSRALAPMSTSAVPFVAPDVARAKYVLGAVEAGARFWRAKGLPQPGRTVLVEAPLRMRIASVAPGVVLVSDRAFELPPFERTRRFHELVVLRAVFAEWIARLVAGREDPADVSWVSDLLATALVDEYVRARYGGPEYAGQILGPFAIHPVIDQLLYAPSIPFADAYFPFIEESDPIREEPERFLNALPRGRRVQAKLEDLLGPERFSRVVTRALASPFALRDVAADVAGEDLRWFWRQWLGRYPAVAYRLSEVDLDRGRVRVERLGAQLREPVWVEGRSPAGESRRAGWDGRSQSGEVALGGPVESVVLDPDFRLLEDPSLADNHPRFDDVYPIPWRPPVFNGFYFGFSVSESQPSLYLDFGMRRLYDLTDLVGFRFAGGARGTDVSVRYLRGFGRLRDTNARQWYAGPILTVTRWNGSFDARSEPATTVEVLLGAVQDTRRYRYDPWRGSSIVFAGGPAFTVKDATGESAVSGSMGVRVAQTLTPAPRHTFAFFEGAGLGFGDLLPAQEQALGGRSLLRGYETDEALGRSAAYAIAEYRWTALAGLDAGAMDLVWARALQPILFVGAGVVGEPSELLRKESVYIDAGLGFRLHFDYGGVQQGVVGLDVGIPISRTLLDWVPECRTAANGVARCFVTPGLLLTFDQTF